MQNIYIYILTLAIQIAKAKSTNPLKITQTITLVANGYGNVVIVHINVHIVLKYIFIEKTGIDFKCVCFVRTESMCKISDILVCIFRNIGLPN